jgi:GT2 family glycosyltransferase
MDNTIIISIIIVSYNVAELTKRCLAGIEESNDNLKKEIIIVDNASSDDTANIVKKNFPEVTLIENKENIGFARANNLAYAKAKGKYVLVINPDVFIEKNTLKPMFEFMEQNSECGILGCRLLNHDKKLQPSARYFPTPWRLFLSYSGIGSRFPNIKILRGVDNMGWAHNSIREVDWIPGCFFLIRKTMIDGVGFFDKVFYMYYEEIDLCLRAKKNGWKIFFHPGASVTHLGGESAKKVGKVTPSGKQLERLKLQSEFIYFKKNYNIIYVLLDFFFISLLDFIDILKTIVKKDRQIHISDKLRHVKNAFNILMITKFGTKPIN